MTRKLPTYPVVHLIGCEEYQDGGEFYHFQLSRQEVITLNRLGADFVYKVFGKDLWHAPVGPKYWALARH